MHQVRWALLSVLLFPGVASAQLHLYYPSAPVQIPYYPPLNYGPGNHYPVPFEGYPGHPVSHFYYPYTYAPYSFYYKYPTYSTYQNSYNPYYRYPWHPPLEWPTGQQGELIKPPSKLEGP